MPSCCCWAPLVEAHHLSALPLTCEYLSCTSMTLYGTPELVLKSWIHTVFWHHSLCEQTEGKNSGGWKHLAKIGFANKCKHGEGCKNKTGQYNDNTGYFIDEFATFWYMIYHDLKETLEAMSCFKLPSTLSLVCIVHINTPTNMLLQNAAPWTLIVSCRSRNHKSFCCHEALRDWFSRRHPEFGNSELILLILESD